MLKIEYEGQIIEIPDVPARAVKVTVTGIGNGESGAEIFHLQGDTRNYILRVTKEKKLILN